MIQLPTTKFDIVETNGFYITKIPQGYRIESAARRVDLRTYAAINMGKLVNACMKAMNGSKKDQNNVRPYVTASIKL